MNANVVVPCRRTCTCCRSSIAGILMLLMMMMMVTIHTISSSSFTTTSTGTTTMTKMTTIGYVVSAFQPPYQKPSSTSRIESSSSNNSNFNKKNKFTLLSTSTTTTAPTETEAGGVAQYTGTRNANSGIDNDDDDDDNDIGLMESSLSSSSSSTTSLTKAKWYATRIQDAMMDYDDAVISLYVRHIVTETPDVAQLALERYLTSSSRSSSRSSTTSSDMPSQQIIVDDNNIDKGEYGGGRFTSDTAPATAASASAAINDPDPFGRLARMISACNATKNDGGTIGWVDRPSSSSSSSSSSSPSEEESEMMMILPNDVIRQLYSKRPKAGDMYIVESQRTNQFHLLLVSELWIQPPTNILSSSILKREGTQGNSNNINNNNRNHDDDSNDNKNEQKQMIGSFTGTNVSFKRKKLKGGGVTPNFQSSSSPSSSSNPNDGYQLRTYEIKTMGCQMNVADSERLEGVLQHQLSLQRRTAATEESSGSKISNNNIDVKGIVVDGSISGGSTSRVIGSNKNSNKQNDDGDGDTAAAAVAASADNNLGPADLVIWNTCSIRDHAEQKVYDAIGPYASRKRKPVTTAGSNDKTKNNNNNNKHSVLIVTGCVAQQEGEDLIKRVPEIDAVIGPQYIPYLPAVLDTILNDGRQVVLTAPNILTHNIQEQQQRTIRQLNVADVGDAAAQRIGNSNTIDNNSNNNSEDGINSVGWYSEPVRGNTVTAFVNVLYGCNEHCTYCVVPATRGMEQSRTMESILQECQGLADQGYKEITLIGQNIDAYGRDMVPKRSFAQLLEFLNNNLRSPVMGNTGNSFGGSSSTGSTGIERIRYVTSHPRYFTDRVIDAVANLDKVCECFHMPFQAGDDDVLKRMRRGYTYESYMKIIRKIRTSAPDAAICADIIVGFPGETDEAFQRTLDLMREVKFDNVNSFAYSPRPNTEAALFDGQVEEHVKADRLQQVQALANQHGLERSERYLHRIEDVLVEDVNPRRPKEQVMGRTRQGRQVYFDGPIDVLKGRTVPVRITEARTWSLMGEMVGVVDNS